MPFTPFHFGPGFFIKSIFPKWFSFRVFILANVVIDFEPLYFIVKDQWPLHRFCHTYLGATVVAIVVTLIAKPVCYWATDIWNVIFKSFKVENAKISNTAVIVSAFVGTYSHVLLDSIMHRDMSPWHPFNGNNLLLHMLSYGQLHLLCVVLGGVGVIIYFFLKKLGKKPGHSKKAGTQ